MKYLISKTNDPYYNLSVEEYLIKNIDDNIFYLYINSPSVIIGKNQNPHTEVGIDYLYKNNIDLVRRLSGGGAVYHDKNNLNYSFILKDKFDEMYDFKKFSIPIIEALNKLNLDIKFSGRNDLLIEDKKISGAAQYSYKNNLLHHGTLLFNTDFSNIEKILIVNKEKLKSKGVKSVKSRIGNISDYLPTSFKIKDLIEHLIKSIGTNEYLLTVEDKKEIELISNGKRNSISFLIKNKKNYMNQFVEYIPGSGTYQIYSNVKKNIITEIKIFGEYFSKKDIQYVEKLFIGKEYTKESISKIVDSIIDFDDYFHNINKNKFKEMILNEK